MRRSQFSNTSHQGFTRPSTFRGEALTTRTARLLHLLPQFLDAGLDGTDVRPAEFIDFDTDLVMVIPCEDVQDGPDPPQRRLHVLRGCNLRDIHAIFEGTVPFAVQSSNETTCFIVRSPRKRRDVAIFSKAYSPLFSFCVSLFSFPDPRGIPVVRQQKK